MTAVATEELEHVGPYRVLRAIGAGGSARIDLARIDRAYGFQRHVVIKRPLEHLRRNANVAASLRREARIASRLRHPNLVAVLDAGVHDDYDYLALEYVHGASLRSLMEHDTPGRVRQLPLGAALAIVAEVAHGMHEAHELTDDDGSPLGLVHRDVSPGNILLGFDGAVKLADFGIAKETRVSTLSGSLHGTVTYMAPEQCQGHAFDRRADIWALGVILHELVTGARLFWADNDVASLHRVLSGAVPRPREVNGAVSETLEAIVMQALARAPADRYPTALAMAEAIERHAADAGELLGARWIARAMQDRLGPQQAPWIAQTAAADEARDGSLVALIAATDADGDAPARFGDDREDDEPGVSGVRTMQLPVLDELPVPPPAIVEASPTPSTAPPSRRWLIGTIAAGLAIGAGMTVLLWPSDHAPASDVQAPITMPTIAVSHEATGPASTAPANAAATNTATANTAPANAAAENTTADVTHRAASIPSARAIDTPALDKPDASAAPASHTSLANKRKRSAGRPHTTVVEDKAVVAPPEPASEPPAHVPAEPPAQPPANVEWKPSLLLPTDGPGTKPAGTPK